MSALADTSPGACSDSAVLPEPGAMAATARLDLIVPGLRCAGCLAAVEREVRALEGVVSARVNLSMKRLGVRYRGDLTDERRILDRLERIGYPARPFDRDALEALDRDAEGRALLTRIGVAGFAAMNVMLLSVAVWSGADGATRELLQWVSALIAMPAVAWAGMPFYRNAWAALRAGRMRMDVPISLAIWLAVGVSFYETAAGGGEAWFEASVSLVFFLLVGRYLDHRARRRARSAAAELSALRSRTALVIDPDGRRRTVPTDDLTPGMLVEIAPGEQVPADGRVEQGVSDVDRALVTGESVPERAGPGATLHAGMMNLSGPLKLRVAQAGPDTLLAEIARMIEAAESAGGRTLRLADRAAAIYAPGVHLIALAAAVGWLAAGADWRQAVLVAAATLIITCPCALGLAVPVVQAVAGGRLFRSGIFLKDGTALEDLARVDTVIFDKTGTLTTGRPRLTSAPAADDPAWPLALALAEGSRHPLARALAAAAREAGVEPAALSKVTEVPGHGVVGGRNGQAIRLGRGDWCGVETEADRSTVWLARSGASPVAFAFEDALRPDAADTVDALRRRGLDVRLVSGDAAAPVRAAAEAAGIDRWLAQVAPAAKLDAIAALRREGRVVLMVGDGINDAPALAAADVSMSPATAAEVAQAGARLVFGGERLAPVLAALGVARQARARMVENLAFAALYNAVAIPVAVLGHATPIIAAIAMSASSLAVTLNALRLRTGR